MDKRRSVLNVTVSLLCHVLLLSVALLVRRILILNIGNEINGLNSLYASIIGMLGVAELGIGRAIVYSMYRPIVYRNVSQIAALYNLYKHIYWIIGGIVFLMGLLTIPFLPKLINDYSILSVNVPFTFLLTLIAVVLTYLYSSKTSLIEAHKDNYIITGITTISCLIKYALQVVVILIWKSFSLFLLCQIIGTLIMWFLTEVVIRNKYREIVITSAIVDQYKKQEIVSNSKAMVMHKFGTIMVQNIDNIIISFFLGVVILGKYSNYSYIATIMVGTISLFFTPLTSIIGHLCAKDNQRKTKAYFDKFYCINFILGVVFFFGYYAVIDYVVTFLFGAGLFVSRPIAFIITLNQFIQYMRNAALLFRNASGAFYYDRWKPVAEGISNLLLSLLFVAIFPKSLRIVGVIVATIITNLFVCDIVEPYVVFKYVFGDSPNSFYIKNYGYISLFAFSLIVMSWFVKKRAIGVVGFFLNGLLSICFSFVIIGLLIVLDKSFRNEVFVIGKELKRWMCRVLH